ncbi:RAP domain [Babesia duncani]|uniref:RAP domain n=1 Tax=Babesia duncani TaxID=323732 RepID=A0AAD9UQ33_9APIC|nr:RAP domain [Babesia duncani]
MPFIRSREREIFRAVKHESRIRRIGKRIHKRFRSWTQQRTRRFWLPEKVSLHTPPELLDGWLLSAAVQKAATIRKHDVKLWFNFSKRAIELGSTLNSQQLGYIYYGFLNVNLYKELMKFTEPMLSTLSSHSLMTVTWALSRVQVRNPDFLSKYSSEIAAKIDDIRTTDLIKICNSLAKLDGYNSTLMQCLSEKMIDKLETIYAQDFRNVVNDLSIINLYDEKTKIYTLTRFSKIFICARPQHLQQAFASAVAVRVLLPRVWSQLDKNVKSFYTRLSMRNIPQILHKPSPFHWDVSNCLAEMGIHHRNTFYWGCYWIDIGEVEQRTNCWVLENLGWNVKRVPWFKWAEMINDTQAKINYLTYAFTMLRFNVSTVNYVTGDHWGNT